MAILNMLSDAKIKSEYTHYAYLHGVPIYFNEHDNSVCTRNWVPDFLLDIGEFMFGIIVQAMMIEAPMYAIKLSGRIERHDC